ncbi:MAG: A24 family peptidase [Candidatus Aquilonibacter sp.]
MGSSAALSLFGVSLLVLVTVARVRSDAVTLRRPAIMILTAGAVLAIIAADRRGTPISVCAIVTLACVVVCAASDIETGLVFDQVTILATIAIVLGSILGRDMSVASIGAGTCAGSTLTLYAATRGRGIGLGDVKLSGVMGAGLGGLASLGALGAAFVAGAVWAIPLLIFKRARPGARVPFAPFLAIGAMASIALRW